MKKNIFVRIAALLAVFALVGAACSSDSTDTTVAATPDTTVAPAPAEVEMGTIVEVASETGSFTTLLAAAEAAGLVDTLQGDGPFTVFAPTDEAFAALPDGTVEGLLEDPATLADILLYHVVSGKVLASDVVGLTSAMTVQGTDVNITVDGSSVMLNDSNVTATDIEASNGVIHVIDAVLLPTPSEPPADAMGTIVEVAQAAGTFETLIAAAQAAGLEAAFSSDGPFTVFAPTDEAFAALPAGTVESLLADPDALSDILLYHAVAGKFLAEDVLGLDAATTLQGSDVTISLDGDSVKINDATVLVTDIEASNGVIHVIDAVILPPVS